MNPSFTRVVCVAFGLNLTAGCSGNVGTPSDVESDVGSGGEGGASGEGGNAGGDNKPDETPAAVIADPGSCKDLGPADQLKRPVARLRRLNTTELGNALGAFLGGSWTGPALPKDVDQTGVLKDIELVTVKGDFVPDYWKVAEGAADRLLANASLAPKCAAADKTCARTFVEKTATRAWRRDATASEVDSLMASFDKGAAVDADSGFSFVIQRVLLSPDFLYLKEDGMFTSDGTSAVIKLSPNHVAEQLSFTLWSSPPDEALLSAVKAGKLATPADVRVQAERLLNDPRARRSVAAFFETWLGLQQVRSVEKNKSMFADFSDEIKNDMAEDSRLTLESLMFSDNADPSALVTSKRAFLTPRLAKFLKQTAGSGATDAKPVAMEIADRKGILTSPSFLALHSKESQNSTVLRGKAAVEHLLCSPVPDPPKDAEVAAADAGYAPGLTLRERMARHSTDLACASCHRVFEPVGDALEGYDPVGRVQTTDAGKPINTKVELKDFYGISGTFNSIADLAPELAKSASIPTCYLSHLGRYALGRALSEESACLAFASAGIGAKDAQPKSMKEMMLSFVTSPAFLERRPAGKEGQ